MTEAISSNQKKIHPAAAAQEFLNRARLGGEEVPVFVETHNWLNDILEGRLVVVPREAYDDFLKENSPTDRKPSKKAKGSGAN